MIARAYETGASGSNHDSMLTAETVRMLNTLLSGQGKEILKVLYECPGIQQKNLAVSIHTSPASLSNCLSKMETIHPSLLKSERIGRSKLYSLTDMAVEYVKSELLHVEKPQLPKIRPFNSPLLEESRINETIHFFELFQNAAGGEWDLVLDNLLADSLEVSKYSDELKNRYTDFLESLIQLRIQQKHIGIRKVYDVINVNLLIKRLDRYLNEKLTDLYCMEPLFDLETQDYEKACVLIDYIFSELRPMIFGAADSRQKRDIMDTPEAYSLLYHQISIMLNEFFNFEGNKTKAIEFWKEKFYVNNASLRYIAALCHSVYLFEQQRK